MKTNRICIFCKHFWIHSGEAGFGDHTPGQEFQMYCSKNKWEFDSYATSTNQYRETLETGLNCNEFVESEK